MRSSLSSELTLQASWTLTEPMSAVTCGRRTDDTCHQAESSRVGEVTIVAVQREEGREVEHKRSHGSVEHYSHSQIFFFFLDGM